MLTSCMLSFARLFCSLARNKLGEVGGTAVAKALKVNTSLK